MSLRTFLLRALDSPRLSVGLFDDGLEVVAVGYTRQPLPHQDGQIRGRLVFGPFARLVRFDEVRLLDGDATVETLHRLSAPLPLPPGAEFAHDLEITIL